MLLNNQLNLKIKLINKYMINLNPTRTIYIYTYILYIYKFFKKFVFFSKNTKQKLFFKKKDMFFKKKERKQILLLRRVKLYLKKKKLFRVRSKKLEKGNFFLKKFFFKTLLKNRKFFKVFFFLNKKKRKNKITNIILKNFSQKKIKTNQNGSIDYSLFNILLRSNLFFFINDVRKYLHSGYVYVNNINVNNPNYIVSQNEIIQIIISKSFYNFYKFSKKLFKKKIFLYKKYNWRFFRSFYIRKKKKLKQKKKKIPKYLNLFFLFKLNSLKTLEIDFLTMSIILLKKKFMYFQSTYFLNKFICFKFFNLYNYKKIN